MNIVAIIPVRSGSKGLADKNIKKLKEKSLIQINIELLKRIELVDKIVVSTESEEYADIARKHGVEAPFLRPPELASDYSSTELTLKHALDWLETNQNYKADILVYQQVNDLFKRKEWIEQCINVLIDNVDIETAFVAKIEHKNYWIFEDGIYQRMTHSGHTARQLKTPIYREDTGLACATRPYLLQKEKRRIGDKVQIIPHEQFSIDIHSEFDFALAEIIIAHFQEFNDLLFDDEKISNYNSQN